MCSPRSFLGTGSARIVAQPSGPAIRARGSACPNRVAWPHAKSRARQRFPCAVHLWRAVRHCTGVTTSREGLTEPAIERLYSELAPKVWRACLAYSGSRDVADEAVAEAFTLAMEHADELRSPAGWIWKVAIRLAGAERERRRGLGEPIPDEAYEMPDPAVELIRALARLSERQRAAVLLHHYA